MQSCATAALNIRTYYAGQNQVTHPNVIEIPGGWHGFRYYMAYTPYPYANGSEENPCLAVSNDLKHWETPDGLLNPIACCEEVQCDELKDTHLLYREDLDRLEMWYLGRLNATMATGGPLYCFRKVSHDGICWSKYEIMYRFDSMNLASESVIYENGLYRFWGIHNDRSDIGLYYMESTDGNHWTELEKCDVPQARETSMWHGTVSLFAETYYYVWVGNAGEGRQTIYLSTSKDGTHFIEPQAIIKNTAGWNFLYRPALLLSDGIYSCFYGIIRIDNRWLIALSQGKTTDSLVGLTPEDLNCDSEHNPGSKKLQLKVFMNHLSGSLVPRLLIVVPLLVVLNLFTHSVVPGWLTAMILCGIAYRIKFDRQHWLRGGLVMGTLCAIFGSFLSQLLLEFCSLF